MEKNKKFNRRRFISYGSLGIAGAFWPGNTFAGGNPFDADAFLQDNSADSETNLIGSYGKWADSLSGDKPRRLSFRNPGFTDVHAWKTRALVRIEELLASPVVNKIPEVREIDETVHDGVSIKKLTWQLPYGPPTEAFFLTPLNVKGKLPGVLALHDHGANKYFGKQKIVNNGKEQHPMMVSHKEEYYSGKAWANELAKQGYAVLVNDTFTFESRKVLLKDVPSVIRAGVSDVSPKESREEIEQYNRWAANHEHIMAKSLFSAGTTWPGVFLSDDRVALSVLGSRKEVDSDRLGCCGLSGGGLRSMMIGGMDERIKAAVCVGMMSTWRDLVLYHSFTHTWMMFVPHLPVEMDYPEIFALQMPAPRMVLNNTEDTLFDLGEMKRADTILKEVYQKAGFPENYMCEFYPGPHKFDAAMQKSAFSWLERWLKK